ncbi:hypothetical protein SKAU_G00019420 [Synaphobranchus kaupii]|uniref:Endonuclease/exonuclease/phosphatase domain-containing protein n=1 Tax=Synaphobranchus kaupii TaxID=118154 RepID=A0A9Q1JEE2_SYNKA|nr:hypothetical protein SKAU_G00019420 [Synaphobranchus kaupii]
MPSVHSLNISSFEFHAVTVTHPSKLNIVVLYCPPGPLSTFLDELDTLLSSFPEDGTPIILLGDFNLQPESSQLSSVASLLQSLTLTQSPSPATHKAGNQLDLVFTRSCATSELTVTPLHVSDHFFISFSLSYPLSHNSSNNLPSVTFRRNLCTLSHSSLSTSALSALPPPASFVNLHIDVATSTFNSCLSQFLDSLCPLVSKPARSSPPCPWLTDSLRSSRTTLRAAERKWRKSRSQDDLASYHTLLAAFTSATTSAKTTFFQSKINTCMSNPRKLFSTFSSLLIPPPPPSPSSLSADDFLIHFEEKVAMI